MDQRKSHEENSVATAYRSNRLHISHIFKTSWEHWVCSLGQGQSSWSGFAPCVTQRSLGSLAGTPAATVCRAVFRPTRTILVCQNITLESKHGSERRVSVNAAFLLTHHLIFLTMSQASPCPRSTLLRGRTRPSSLQCLCLILFSLRCEPPGTLYKALMRPKQRLT